MRSMTTFSTRSGPRTEFPSVTTRFEHELILSQKLAAIRAPMLPLEAIAIFGRNPYLLPSSSLLRKLIAAVPRQS